MCDECHCGLRNPAAAAKPAAASVSFFQRHVFFCTGTSSWSSSIEDDGGLIADLARRIKPLNPTLAKKVKLTACSGPSRSDAGMDLLIFPDAVRYFGITSANVGDVIEEHFVNNRICSSLPHEPLLAPYLFVCAHQERDYRCGSKGPPVIDALRRELATAGLPFTVCATSHVGGHSYAGNVLIYPSGDWFGYVEVENVPLLVNQYFVQKTVPWCLWRGRMGLDKQEQEAAAAQYLANHHPR